MDEPIIRTLYPTLQKLALCRTRADVSGVAIDGVKMAFASRMGAVAIVDDSARIADRALLGGRDVDFDEWGREWLAHDRVFRAVLERAAPVHAFQVYGEKEYVGSLEYTEYAKRLGIHHYMAAPLFGFDGRVTGVLNFCRPLQDRPFDARTLALASAFAGFVSATLARVTPQATSDDEVRKVLAFRELQVARLAASGLNNLQIAHNIGIARETVKQTLRRVYRKLEVTGRASMSAKLGEQRLLRR